METKELNIEIPVGYEIDKEKSTFEKIIFKKKDNRPRSLDKPRSWKEYLELNTGFGGVGIDWNMDGGVQTTGLHHRGKAIVPTNLAAPFIAMMQLMSLRQEWIGDWEPDFNRHEEWVIGWDFGYVLTVMHYTALGALSFPTKEIAQEFLECFRNLLEEAKGLY